MVTSEKLFNLLNRSIEPVDFSEVVDSDGYHVNPVYSCKHDCFTVTIKGELMRIDYTVDGEEILSKL